MNIYLIFVFLLFALAISDLIVGVSNDAVNFLNSAIGSKVAPRYVIMIVASIGIIVGATFSNGMMEVARKGIFHPQNFYFTEIMVVFMAVMLTDILLLDFFNTIGLPTSTTVSIVFELLGAAVAVALVKIGFDNQTTLMVDGVERVANLGDFINSSKALAIITGILLSVVISFVVGLIVQAISRLIFTFNYKKPIKYFGSVWGGLAISAITYFILIKGAKDASFMSADAQSFIKHNTIQLIFASLIFWTVVMQLMQWIFKTNVLKVIVLFGTFALAMAFAGNDLVNFIGVPLAGFEAFKQFQSNGGNDILMSGLAVKVHTPTYFLIIAGLIMVATLWFSKKARSVTETELNLARQDEGNERFGSSLFARVLVRRSVSAGTFFSKIIPEPMQHRLRKRFDQTESLKKFKKQENPPMFDLVRASVNLTVASILIAIATTNKLPLSTTYVTFMVAMGTSLADGAWGRDSAVYRITGVFSVIGGWFLTALIAFTVAFLIALLISWAQIYAVIVLAIVAIIAVYKSSKSHAKKAREKSADIEALIESTTTTSKIVAKCSIGVSDLMVESASIFKAIMKGLVDEDRKKLRKQLERVEEINAKTKSLKNSLPKTIAKLQNDSVETGHFYVQVLDYEREISHSLKYIIDPVYNHVENQHKAFIDVQADELLKVADTILAFSTSLNEMIVQGAYDKFDSMLEKQNEIMQLIHVLRKNQIKRIKNKEVGTRNSMLYLNIMSEARNLLLYLINTAKAQREFVKFSKESNL
jgi:phosphate/sulfate permease